MAGVRGFWRAAALLLLLAPGAAAQDTAAVGASVVVLTLDQDRFFLESQFGRTALERERAAAEALEAENSRIEQELIAEEQALTELRKTLPAEEFATRARAFDDKVERIRGEQDAKLRDLSKLRDTERQAFLRVAVPVLGELMTETGAVVIIDKSTIILSLTEIDITDEAIARVDRALAAADAAPATP